MASVSSSTAANDLNSDMAHVSASDNTIMSQLRFRHQSREAAGSSSSFAPHGDDGMTEETTPILMDPARRNGSSNLLDTFEAVADASRDTFEMPYITNNNNNNNNNNNHSNRNRISRSGSAQEQRWPVSLWSRHQRAIYISLFSLFLFSSAIVLLVLSQVQPYAAHKVFRVLAPITSIMLFVCLMAVVGASLKERYEVNSVRGRRRRIHAHYRRVPGGGLIEIAPDGRQFPVYNYEAFLELERRHVNNRIKTFLEGASQGTIDSLPAYEFKPPPPPSGKLATETRQTKSTQSGGSGIGSSSSSDDTENNTERGTQCTRSTSSLMETTGEDRGGKISASMPQVQEDKKQEVNRALDEEDDEEEEVKDPRFTCQVCLDWFLEGQMIRILPCFHQFHATCVDPWLLQKSKCPLCKTSILDLQMPNYSIEST